jgi:hypothetical protein
MQKLPPAKKPLGSAAISSVSALRAAQQAPIEIEIEIGIENSSTIQVSSSGGSPAGCSLNSPHPPLRGTFSPRGEGGGLPSRREAVGERCHQDSIPIAISISIWMRYLPGWAGYQKTEDRKQTAVR